MFSFTNDYSETAHPRVLQALADAAPEQNCGYGLERHCQEAAELRKTYAPRGYTY